jgi:hypothetical protein
VTRVEDPGEAEALDERRDVARSLPEEQIANLGRACDEGEVRIRQVPSRGEAPTRFPDRASTDPDAREGAVEVALVP